MKNKKQNIKMKLVKMDDIKFNDDLFIPIKSKTIVDSLLSTEGGVFPGTNTVVIGDPGVGKSTVLLDLLEKNNKANNKLNKHTAFICIQQMTKQGEFAGSNRIKHMTTAMAALRFDGRGRDAERYIEFSKNRRGSVGEKVYFNLARGGKVDYSFEFISEGDGSPLGFQI